MPTAAKFIAPEIHDSDVAQSVRALTRAATFIHKALVHLIQGGDRHKLLREHGNALILSERVLAAWRDRFGMDLQDMLVDAEARDQEQGETHGH